MPPRTGRWALLIATGIFLSRITGLIRDRVFAHFFGNSDAADAYRAAFRIPNLLQNLFGEGALSASMIPVYAALTAAGKETEARKLANAIFALLALTISILVLVGVCYASAIVAVITPGFLGEKRELTVQLVKILFPGAGLLVLSAWCLAILNSHRRFFLPYAAPVVWNLAIIAALLRYGGSEGQNRLAEIAAWGAVAGSALQFLLQIPSTVRLLRGLKLSTGPEPGQVNTVVANFLPAVMSRGVSQVSAFIDEIIASLLPTGAMAALSYAQTLYLLPVSLFGMSVSAAELPEMASATGDPQSLAEHLRSRLVTGLRRIAFFVIPTVVGFLVLGDVIVALVYRTGNFSVDDVRYVWLILAGASVGLLAATQGRLLASCFYALRDTRTPLRFAIARVILAGAFAYGTALRLPEALQLDARWGIVGVTLASGLAAWVEYFLLKRSLSRRIGAAAVPVGYGLRLWGAAALAAFAAWGAKILVGDLSIMIAGVLVLGVYGGVYLSILLSQGVPEAKVLMMGLARRLG